VKEPTKAPLIDLLPYGQEAEAPATVSWEYVNSAIRQQRDADHEFYAPQLEREVMGKVEDWFAFNMPMTGHQLEKSPSWQALLRELGIPGAALEVKGVKEE
jgi:hypothetical protein